MTDEIEIAHLDERYARLRVVRPTAERAVRESLRRLGQLMPIVACERASSFAVVDGFKRLSAARELGLATLRARVMPLNETAAIAALMSLNRAGRGMTDLEEALVVQALCRDHGLEQVAIAELLGRHKSWVCRRLALVERLDETVTDDVRAGLVTTTVAREVARLPRGNQALVAAAIRRATLTSREAGRLVTLFAKTSGAAQQTYLLEHPREAVEAHVPRPLDVDVSVDPRLGPITQRLQRHLFETMSVMGVLAARLEDSAPLGWTETERAVIHPVMAKTRHLTELLLGKLVDTERALKVSHAA